MKEFKDEIHKLFEMTDIREMSYFLGMEIHQDYKGIFICQRKHANEVLVKFGMKNNKLVSTPLVQNEKLIIEDGTDKIDGSVYKSLIGCLLYLTATRPNVMFAASLLSRFMQKPSELHFKAAKRVLRYVKGSLDHGIWHGRVENLKFVGFTNSDWVGSQDDMKSTSPYVFIIGSSVFNWNSKK